MSDAVTVMIERGRGKKHAGVKERVRWLGALSRKRDELIITQAWCEETCRALAEEYKEHGLVHTAARILREMEIKMI